MQSALYVMLSGQVSIDKTLKSIANNIANMNTAGFRAEGTTFEAVLSMTGRVPTAFAGSGKEFITRQPGPMTPTGNNLDVAVRGDAWIAIQTPGGVSYSRDGRMIMNDMGDLTNINGLPILDQGGAPLVVDPNAGEISIAPDGSVSQRGMLVGAIGLYQIAPGADLLRSNDGSVSVDAALVVPVDDFVNNGVMQGYVEGANISPVVEMTRLIDGQRKFENTAAASNSIGEALSNAIRDLGPTS